MSSKFQALPYKAADLLWLKDLVIPDKWICFRDSFDLIFWASHSAFSCVSVSLLKIHSEKFNGSVIPAQIWLN